MINYYANLTATIAFYYSVLVQHTEWFGCNFIFECCRHGLYYSLLVCVIGIFFVFIFYVYFCTTFIINNTL